MRKTHENTKMMKERRVTSREHRWELTQIGRPGKLCGRNSLVEIEKV